MEISRIPFTSNKHNAQHYSTGYVARGLLPYREEKEVFSINMAIYNIDNTRSYSVSSSLISCSYENSFVH